jgi:hypothetical protein
MGSSGIGALQPMAAGFAAGSDLAGKSLTVIKEIRLHGAFFGDCGSHFEIGSFRQFDSEVLDENVSEFLGTPQLAPFDAPIALADGELVVVEGVSATWAGARSDQVPDEERPRMC